MKRLITYPIVFLVLILIEGAIGLEAAFDIKNYEPIGWIAQGLAVLFGIGISEEWYRDLIKPSKT